MSSQSSSSSKSSINSSNLVNESTTTAASAAASANSNKPLPMKTMQLPKSTGSFRRNSDTILMNQYLKLPMSAYSQKKVMFKSDSSNSTREQDEEMSGAKKVGRSRARSNELVVEEDEMGSGVDSTTLTTSGVDTSTTTPHDCSQTSLVFSDNDSTSATTTTNNMNINNNSSSSNARTPPSHSSNPQSPISSPNQSQQSLLHQKLSSLIRLGLSGSDRGGSSNSSNASQSTETTITNPSGGSSNKSHFVSSFTSPSKSVVQYLNDKFLRKRHSVSILKFNNHNNNSSSSGASASSSSHAGHAAASALVGGFLNVSPHSAKLEKSASNHSFHSTNIIGSTPQIRLLPDTHYIYGNSSETKPSFTVGPPATPTTTTTTTTNDSTTSPTRLKIPFKLKNSASRAGSFKAKRKTKRSKSAPINQRRILVNSTFYTLLSTNYGDTLLSPGAGGGQLSPTSAAGAPGHHPNQPMCLFCEQKRYSQVQCHIFTTSLQEELMRRTNFSRRNYGSLELLFTLDREGIIQNIGKFRIENGDSRECLNTSNTIHLENPESQTRWYFKYFLGRIHQNYMIEDKNKNIYFLSVVITDANDRHIPLYKVILWTKLGSQKLTLTYQHNKSITVKQILNHFPIETDKSPKEILDPDIQKELLVLEEQEGSINFKFGVVYAKHGQLTDDEMLSNENGSPEFEKFINLIGDKIRLKGWKRYRGGLDTSSDTTGEHSIYTIYEGHEIMFHVSTLLPYVRDSKQQLERKRHIGNDIVTIVFQDLDDDQEPDFNPSSARSQFQHIFALVTYNKKENSYRLKIYSEQSVPPFGPSLPAPPVFMNHKEFREFLLVKLINGEKSAFNNSVFGKRRKRTIEAIITNLYKNYEKDSYKYKVVNNSSGIGDVISDALTSGNTGKRKEEMRKADFLRIGQNLKLQTIIKGDAPTSQLTTGAVKKELWEPRVFLLSFEHSIVCSDSWNNCLVVGTMNGVFVIDEALPWDIKQIFDKSVQLRQLDICELNGLMIMCDLKGHISVFRLCEFAHFLTDSNWDSVQTKSKAHCKERRLEFMPGACQAYAIGKQLLVNKSNNNNNANNNNNNANQTNTNNNKSSSSSSSSCCEQPAFRMIAACGRKLLLIEYNNSSPSSSSMTCLHSSMMCNSCNVAMNSSSIANSIMQNPIVGVTQLASQASNLPATSSTSSPAAATGIPAPAQPLSSSASGQNLCGEAAMLSMMNAAMSVDRNDIVKMFQIKKEFTCSDVPNLINLVTSSFSGENYILVSYKNKCELLSERTGECLKQFQFNPMSSIRSIVELYDNNKLEILVTYNYTSEFIKLDENLNNQSSSSQSSSSSSSSSNQIQSIGSSNKKSYYTFQWNSEPNFVICAFPYIIGFANQCIEIRLLVNGNLVNSITMSNIKLIASKKDIFFSADHELFLTNDLSLAERHLNSLVISLNNTNVNNNLNNNNSSVSGTSGASANSNSNHTSSTAESNECSPPSSPPVLNDKDNNQQCISPPVSASFFPSSSSLNVSKSLASQSQSQGLSSLTLTNNSQSGASTTSAASSTTSASTTTSTMATAAAAATKTPCSIYKISLDFLHQSNAAKIEKFNQLCENSTRTIQREISDFSSQFIFTDSNDLATMPKQYSFYQKIISSNKKDENENNMSEF